MGKDYVIRNTNHKVYIRLDKDGRPETCVKEVAQRFEHQKANNILNSLPKTLKKFHFKVDAISPLNAKNNEKNVISTENYIPPESVTRWLEKFGECDDILSEAKQRMCQLINELDKLDKEIIDILHIIEIESSKNMYGGWLLYKKIKENRNKRRYVKDEIMIIQDVIDNIDSSLFDRKRIQKSIDGLFTRKYAFRVVEGE